MKKIIIPIFLGLSMIVISACNTSASIQNIEVSVATATGTNTSELTATVVPTVKPAKETTKATTEKAKETTPKPTKSPTPTVTPKPTETTAKPTETTAAPTTPTTTAPPPPPETTAPPATEPPPPPPTETAAPTETTDHFEDPDVIREGIIQFCKDNGVWYPDGEVKGGDEMSFSLGYLYSNQEYIDVYNNGKIIPEGNKWYGIVSVSCWIENGWIYISSEVCYLPES